MMSGAGYLCVVRAQPLIVVRDVRASSHFYQALLGCAGGHGGAEYERLYDPKLHYSKWGSDGLILQLHAWEVDHHHGHLGDPEKPIGNGMMLWFEVDDFDAVVARARALEARVVLDVHVNPNALHRELWILDPDGYTVVVASVDGEAEIAAKSAKKAEPKRTAAKPAAASKSGPSSSTKRSGPPSSKKSSTKK